MASSSSTKEKGSETWGEGIGPGYGESMCSERNESTRPGGAGAVRPDSLAYWGLTAVLANGRLRRRRTAAAFVSAAAIVVLAGACGTSGPSLPGWAANGPSPVLAGHALPAGAALDRRGPGGDLVAQGGTPAGAPSASPASAGDRPLTPPPLSISPASGGTSTADVVAGPSTSQSPGGTWAVVIGINTYPGGGAYNLESAVNDANDMATALQDEGVPSGHVLMLRDGSATASEIRASTNWLVGHAGPDATAVFFYAGHTEKLSPSTEALIGSDGGQVTNGELARRFAGLAAGRAWFVFAACYGGGFDNLLAAGRIVTAAADANHLAYENETFHRSYLVEYMIRQAMIEGRAPGSVQDAFAYAAAAIHRDYPGREPVEADDLGSPLDLGPATPVGSPPASPPSPAPPAPAPSTPAPPPPPSPPTTTPPSTDACSSLTLGVVRCGS